MRSRSQELVDKSTAAMLAALEAYNKPNALYRAESFAILATNAWELLLKAYWLQMHNNNLRSLYVRQTTTKRDGSEYLLPRIKRTRSGNAMTHSLDFIAKKLVEKGELEQVAFDNIEVLVEFRDTAVHYFNSEGGLSERLHAIASAAVRNFCHYVLTWFEEDLSGYNLYLMPLAFVGQSRPADAVVLTKQEQRLAAFIRSLEKPAGANSKCDLAVAVKLEFVKTKGADAIPVQLSNDANAPKLQLSDDQIRQRYPMTYDELVERCKKRYTNFKIDRKFHEVRKPLHNDAKYCMTRYLNPGNPAGSKMQFYSEAVLAKLDAVYSRSGPVPIPTPAPSTQPSSPGSSSTS